MSATTTPEYGRGSLSERVAVLENAQETTDKTLDKVSNKLDTIMGAGFFQILIWAVGLLWYVVTHPAKP